MANPVITTNRRGFRRDVSVPRTPVPQGACDTHMHIVGSPDQYPFTAVRSLSPPPASWNDYKSISATLGLSRCVIVQPSFYGTDNRCTLDAVAESRGRARAVVVVDGDISTAEITRMNHGGARGVRIQMVSKGGVDFDAIETLAERIAPFGWHLQLYVDAEDLLPLAGRLRALPVPIVFDHMAHVIESNGTGGPGFRVLLDLLSDGRAWVKLSNALFPPSAERARILAQANPDRVLWGTDWPHVAYAEDSVPDDGALVDALGRWIPDVAAREKALVANPGRLYFQT